VTRLLILLATCGGPALAQELDCMNAFTQADMNQCADIAFQDADATLNDVYATALDVAGQINEYSESDAVAALREAQRAWITFRDLACEVETISSEGGSIRPMEYSNCLERLTWQRINDLHIFIQWGG
jgi:uncharacterized protein YecT (DUF1311 family)